MFDVALSVIIPTRGRPTLREALLSLMAGGITADDEVVIVVDGTDNVPGVDVQVKAVPDFPAQVFIQSVPEAHDYGNTPRNAGLATATGTHIMYLDDDDFSEPGALAVIRQAVAEAPDRPHMFRFVAQWGETLPVGPFLVKSRCGGHGFVTPNDPAKLAPWGLRYEGDWDHIKGTVDNYGGESAVVFHEQVVARCRAV